MLNPPSMVPSSSVALIRETSAHFFALGNLGQESCLDLGRVIDAGGNAICKQFDEEGLLASGRVLQELDQFFCLLLGKGSGGMPSAARSATCWR